MPPPRPVERVLVRCLREGCVYTSSALNERRAIGHLVDHLRLTHGLQLTAPLGLSSPEERC